MGIIGIINLDCHMVLPPPLTLQATETLGACLCSSESLPTCVAGRKTARSHARVSTLLLTLLSCKSLQGAMADYRKFEEGRDQGDFSLLPELHASLSCLKVQTIDGMLYLLHSDCQPWRCAARAALDCARRRVDSGPLRLVI